MTCDAVLGSIVALLDGELEGAERRDVELHLAACASCRGELQTLRATQTVLTRHLAGVAEQATGGSFDTLWQRVKELPDERSQGEPERLRGRTPGRAAVAQRSARRRTAAWASLGGFALAAGLALVVLRTQSPTVAPPRPDVPQAAPAAAPPPSAKAARPATQAVAKAPVKEKTQLAKADPVEPAPAKPEDESPAKPDDESSENVTVASHELDPPRELLERPELFINYPIVRRLEELRHLDSVLAETPDDGSAG